MGKHVLSLTDLERYKNPENPGDVIIKWMSNKRGKYDGGTFAHPDIALEFASWIDPAFKLYLMQEKFHIRKQ